MIVLNVFCHPDVSSVYFARPFQEYLNKESTKYKILQKMQPSIFVRNLSISMVSSLMEKHKLSQDYGNFLIKWSTKIKKPRGLILKSTSSLEKDPTYFIS